MSLNEEIIDPTACELTSPRVGLVRAESTEYPIDAPFHPSEPYPEYRFAALSRRRNAVYAAVREMFRVLRLDIQRFGTRDWNPLGALIRPGDNVVLKPNFVMDRHYTGGSYDSVVTHGSVIRAVLDYVLLAVGNTGSVMVADAPMIDNDFSRIVEQTGLDRVRDFMAAHGTELRVHDLRVENVRMQNGLIVKRIPLAGDPAGYVRIDLGDESAFRPVSSLHRRLRGSDYDGEETGRHHNAAANEYLLSGSVLASDVFINLPKLKTHKKIGVTLNLKNLIGINGDKNWIPHYRIGGPARSGDEFPTSSILRHMESLLKDRFKARAFRLAQANSVSGLFVARQLRGLQKTVVEHTSFAKIRAGGWHGNDTIWRSVLDLNKILLYANKSGQLQESPQRRFMSLVDGIVGGEGDGPLITQPRACGILVAGFNPLAVDLVATQVMGFDHTRIAQFVNALQIRNHPLMTFARESIRCMSNVDDWNTDLNRLPVNMRFKAPTGWEGYSEIAS